MIIRRAFRYRLEPGAAHRVLLARFAGSCRYVWNRALAEQKARLERGERTAGYAEMCRWLTTWRHDAETAWLAEVHVAVFACVACGHTEHADLNAARNIRDKIDTAAGPAVAACGGTPRKRPGEAGTNQRKAA